MLAQWDGVGADSRNTVNQLSVRACIKAFRATNTVERGAYSLTAVYSSARKTIKYPALVCARTNLTPSNHHTAVDKCDDASG